MWLRLDRRVVPAAPENKNEIKQGVVMRFKFANRVAAWAFAVASAAMLSAFADGAKRPMTLVVMVDGLRADAVETGEMPNLERLRAGKWQPSYKSAWSVTGEITPGSAPT